MFFLPLFGANRQPPKTRRKAKSRRPLGRRLQFEALDAREVMAADLAVEIAGLSAVSRSEQPAPTAAVEFTLSTPAFVSGNPSQVNRSSASPPFTGTGTAVALTTSSPAAEAQSTQSVHGDVTAAIEKLARDESARITADENARRAAISDAAEKQRTDAARQFERTKSQAEKDAADTIDNAARKRDADIVSAVSNAQRGVSAAQDQLARSIDTARGNATRDLDRAKQARDAEVRTRQRDADRQLREQRDAAERKIRQAEDRRDDQIEDARRWGDRAISNLPRLFRGVSKYVRPIMDEVESRLNKARSAAENAIHSIKEDLKSAEKNILKTRDRLAAQAGQAFDRAQDQILSTRDRIIQNARDTLDRTVRDLTEQRDRLIQNARAIADQAFETARRSQANAVSVAQGVLDSTRQSVANWRDTETAEIQARANELRSAVQTRLAFTQRWLQQAPTRAASLLADFRARISDLADSFESLTEDQKEAVRQPSRALVGKEFLTRLTSLALPPIPDPAQVADNLWNQVEHFDQRINESVDDVLTTESIFFQDAIAGLENAVDLLKQGRFEAAGLAILQGLWNATLESALYHIALPVDEVIDNVATGIGIVHGRRLSDAETQFVQGVFHDHIGNLDRLRIVETPFDGAGMTAGTNFIFIGANPMSDTPLFAHELTHVYQDQRVSSPGTLGATKEQIHSLVGGPNPYTYTLTTTTNWDDLGMEQQAAVVQAFENDRLSPTLSATDWTEHRRVLTQAGFF